MRWYQMIAICLACLVCTVLIFLSVSCDKDSDQSLLDSADPTDASYDPVFNADGGFVITYGMLKRRFNEITFPGTHNSFAGVGANWTEGTCKNQGMTISEQLENGIRYIEFDLDNVLNVYHGGCIGDFNSRLEEVKGYAYHHPGQVILVRISDVHGLDSPPETYSRVNGRLEDTHLDDFIYNWDPTKEKSDVRRCYVPDPWPTLGEIIQSGRNVIFLHERAMHKVVDEGYCRHAQYGSGGDAMYTASIPEQFAANMLYWDPPQERQSNAPYRLLLTEVCPDGVGAGCKESASKNNDGRRLYQMAKRLEDEIMPDNRVVNFINVDYFNSSNAWHLPINVVDACNRLNYERFGIDWETSDCFWELYPFEFDDTKVEYISQIANIQAEVAQVIDDLINQRNLNGHEDKGLIRATTYHTQYDWKRVPEWALDNDLFTRWCGSSSNDNHAWGIDLGERKEIEEIAIAWEFSHKRPGFKVYASNDDGRFADGIDKSELENDNGWQVVAEGFKQNVYGNLWDVLTPDGGVYDWRYIKIKVTDSDSEHWPSFWEVKLYGPAN